MNRCSLLLSAAASGFLSCTSPPEHIGSADGGTSDAGMMAMPAPVAMPMLTPCPDGWTEHQVAGVTVCDPTAGVGPQVCPQGEAHFVGTSGCRPVGVTCPSGEFAQGLPASNVLYVRPGGTGNGTQAEPFGTINEALGQAMDGTVIALAAGTYDEVVRLKTGVTLQGACAARTWIRPSTSGGASVRVPADVTNAALVGVGIGPSDNAGAVIQGHARLEGVVVEQAMAAGILVAGGRLVAQDTVVRGTRPQMDGTLGGGVTVLEGSEATFRRAVFEANHQYGLTLVGSQVELLDVASRANQEGAIPGLGAGVVVQAGGILLGERIELSNGLGVGALVADGAELDLIDAVIRGTRGVRPSDQGFGISLDESRVSLRRTVVIDSEGTAIGVPEAGDLTLANVVVADVVPTPDNPGWAVGVSAGGSARLMLSHVRISGTAAAGLSVNGQLSDPLGAILTATDLSIVDVADLGISGLGLYLSAVQADIERLHIERSVMAGVILMEHARLNLRDGVIEDTAPDPDDGHFGRGIEVSEDAEIEAERLRLVGQHEVALLFGGSGVSQLRDVLIRETWQRGCAETSCADAPGGMGVSVYGGHVNLSRFRIEDVPLCGVQVAADGQLDLHDGWIADVSVGACVQVEDYDVSRLADDVVYDQAQTSIQLTEHAVPAPQPPPF